MPTSPVSLIEHFCRDEPSDGELLGRFVEHRDVKSALGVRHQSARSDGVGSADACWITTTPKTPFNPRSSSLSGKRVPPKPREMVGNWLYGVARQGSFAGEDRREAKVEGNSDDA